MINVLGGIAVLGSYAEGFINHSNIVGLAWGNVPVSWRGLYSLAMAPAALGYFPMTYFLLFRVDLARPFWLGLQTGVVLGFLYLVVLVFSALWFPLTLQLIEQPNPALWAAVHALLVAVGLASCGLIACTIALRPDGGGVSWAIAVAGSLFFTFQTGVLDALVWPAYFPHP